MPLPNYGDPGGVSGWSDALLTWLKAGHDDDTGGHVASSVAFTPTGSIAATNTQAAIAEVGVDADTAVAHISDTSAAHAASAISFAPTTLVAGTDVQAAIAEVGTESRWSMVHADDYANISTAAAACVSGNVLYLAPKTYSTAVDVAVPAGVHVWGYGATVRFTANATFRIDNLDTVTLRGVTFDGNNLAAVPLRIGTGAGGQGTKSHIVDVRIRRATTTAMEIQNLQNSQITNLRISDCDTATTGLLIDNGTKNLMIYGFWASNINGPYCKITTSGGSQQTSKIIFWGGLFEIGQGFRLEDCSEVAMHGLQLLGSHPSVDDNGVYLVAGGNRDRTGGPEGDGPVMPSSVQIFDSAVSGWDVGIHIAGNMATPLIVGGLTMTNTVNYKVEHTSSRIKEAHPHQSENGTRYESVVGLAETTAIQRDVGPINVPITTADLTWTDMPAAATELGGVTDYRKWQDLAQMRFVRLTARVKTAGAAGAKLQLKYRTTDDVFSGASAIGTSEVELAIDATGSVKSAWVPLASGAKVAEVLVMVGGITGDAAADPVLSSITAQFA